MRKRSLNKFGYTMIEVLLVASVMGVVPVSVYIEAQKSARTIECVSNLRNVYMGVQLYEMDFERIPDAKFYPKSPKDDPRSIVNILGNYIDDKRVFLCTTMPDELSRKGLTYIWNDSYNKKHMDRVSNKSMRWLMTEISAADTKIPPPHNGSYNVLFFDGHVATVKEAVHMSPTVAYLKSDKAILSSPIRGEEWGQGKLERPLLRSFLSPPGRGLR